MKEAMEQVGGRNCYQYFHVNKWVLCLGKVGGKQHISIDAKDQQQAGMGF